MYHMCTHRRDAHRNSGIPVFWSHIVTLLSSGLWRHTQTHTHTLHHQNTLVHTIGFTSQQLILKHTPWQMISAACKDFYSTPYFFNTKGLQTAMWRGCQRHLQQSFTSEASVSRLSYLATISNYKGMSVCKLARSINVCGKHTFTSVFMGAIKALQRCETCHPADLQQKTLRTSHSYLSVSSCPTSDFPLRGSALSLIVYAKEPMMGKTLSDQCMIN